MIWAAGFLAVLVCLHIYQRLISRRSRRMLADLPSFATLPFIGNMHKFTGIRNNIFEVYANISELVEETNMPFVIWFGNKPCVVVSDPDDMRAVSVANLNKSYIYNFSKELIGDGLVSAPGSLWKQNIKKLGVAFKPSNIDGFQEVFNRHTRHWVKNINALVDGGPFDMLHKYLNMTTLVTIAESALGVSVDGDAITENYTKAFLRILEILLLRIVNVYLHYDAVFRLTPIYRDYKNCVNTIHDVTKKVLRQRVRNMEGNHDSGKTSTKSFLEILLEMRKTNPIFTDEEIICEVTTILMAGHETVARALNFILITIGCRPDVQRKMCDEIWHIFGDTRRDVSNEDLGRLYYCEAVIYEVLRLYPPVPGCLREVEQDVQLKSCVLPKGIICSFNLYGSGRSRRIWGQDALVCRPERWLDPLTAAKNASAFIGFSTGKRTCIGKRYAINLLKTMLVHFLTNYEISSDPRNMILQINVLLQPISGNLIQIRRRERKKVV